MKVKRYGIMGNTGLEVSRLALGCGFRGLYETKEASSVIDAVIDMGVNFIDCSNTYRLRSGIQAEYALGASIKGRRDKLVITSKFGAPVVLDNGESTRGADKKNIYRSLEDSLRRLETDYLDLYLLHIPDPNTRLDETVEALDHLYREGKIRGYGLCNHTAEQVKYVLDFAEENHLRKLSVVQNPCNLINRAVEKALIPLCKENNVGFMAYSPLAAGILSGAFSRGKKAPEKSTWGYDERYKKFFELFFPGRVHDVVECLQDIADKNNTSCVTVATAWLLSHDDVTACLAGSDSAEEFLDSFNVFNMDFEENDMKALDELSEGMAEGVMIMDVLKRLKNA